MVKFSRKSAYSALWVSKNDRLSDFYVSSWQRGESPMPMLILRLFLTAIAVGILIWSLIEGATRYWMIYLTNWGLLLVVATMISGLSVSLSFLCRTTVETTILPWHVSLFWLLFNLSVTMSVMITVLYWTLIYSPEAFEEEENPTRAFWLDLSTHGFTSCIMMTELLTSRIPLKLAHIYQPLGIGLWYGFFSVIYYAAGGTDGNGNKFIYEVLNWHYGKRTTVVVICSVIGLVILYLVLVGITFCRDKMSIALVRTTSHELRNIPAPHNNQLESRVV